MPARKETIREDIELPESEANRIKMHAIREVLEKHGPLCCRAVVPAYAVKDFEHGFYAPWYVAHVDPNMITDEALARVAGEYADREGYLFHPTDGLSAFMHFLEQQHGYIGLFTYHDGYCTLEGSKAR
jgi:hypothetical protein